MPITILEKEKAEAGKIKKENGYDECIFNNRTSKSRIHLNIRKNV
jgi:hypothetical protein